MFNRKLKKLGIIAGLSLTLAAAGCGQESSDASSDSSGGGDESASNVGEAVEYTITGIEPGAGITAATDRALEEYENLNGWEQETSSTAAMLSELEEAIQNEEPIIVTGWSPHFMFTQYDLKYLEDPQGVYEGEERITTIVREGLQEEMPEAYTILDRIYFELPQVEEGMLRGQEMDFNYEAIAQDWVEQNQETVAEWTEGVEPVDGDSIELVTTTWDEILFTSHVAVNVLEQLGYDVTLTTVDPAIVFEAITTGDADASLAPWVPMTHGALYEEHKGDFEDLGANVEGARSGFVVPSYMDIDSIEDLEPNE